VVDEKAPANPCPRVNLDAAQGATEMGEEARQESQSMPPQKMGYAMKPKGM
jgi:hypothetical protein